MGIHSGLLKEIGDEAIWSLSTAKPGNGVEQLRDDCNETFWQSDGAQPHLINIQFARKRKISEIHIFTSFRADESYTPSQIAVRIGDTDSCHDLQEIQVYELNEPDGWAILRLARQQGSEENDKDTQCVPRDPNYGGAVDFIRSNFVQLAILANHQNGRDTHVRQIRIYGPRTESFKSPLQFQTPAMTQFMTLR